MRHDVSQELEALGLGETYGATLRGRAPIRKEESESETFGNGDTSSPLTGDVSPDRRRRQRPAAVRADVEPDWIHDPEARRERIEVMQRENQERITELLADHALWKATANAGSVVDLT